ncbi:uncharacterized protein LOC143193926 isoform X3 [Rhynchophorus ferrugineus]|uniref:uncharacterized protein LOC143193926 isoform X3 n=1 Tax=Rhynchophorus ferrugineus TaxID=354439 RepID=UPI003FCE853D
MRRCKLGEPKPPGSAPVVSVSQLTQTRKWSPPGGAPVVTVSKLPMECYEAPVVSMEPVPGSRIESRSWTTTETTYPAQKWSQPGGAPIVTVSKLSMDRYETPVVSMEAVPGSRIDSRSWTTTETTYPAPQVTQYTTVTYPATETVEVIEASNILGPRYRRYPQYPSWPTTDYVQVIEAENILDKNVEIPPPPGPAPVVSAWELVDYPYMVEQPNHLDQLQPRLPELTVTEIVTPIDLELNQPHLIAEDTTQEQIPVTAEHDPPPPYSSLGIDKPAENIEASGSATVPHVRTLLDENGNLEDEDNEAQLPENNPLPDTASARKMSEWLAMTKDSGTHTPLDDTDLPPPYSSLGLDKPEATDVKEGEEKRCGRK